MQVLIHRPVWLEQRHLPAGLRLELPEEAARALIAMGSAVALGQAQSEAKPEPQARQTRRKAA
ncbi:MULTISPECIES: hypothetical protein [Tepidimonas]|jgi:hypothetical protein|uniref:Uncharacterized protein n=2 Tax=Tepidimonas TaxID=114248 RepID=A0A554XB67_9BURK|nr:MULTISPECIES: hypothetical protein [Tepidimonas]MCX8016605.1 hypothetical protein [Rhodocyclaceae bacterium]TCS98780.1 hypothetical protein EDC36_104204 [Tepidimonas ignava]TSE20295.1 hypothetical protein Tigna_01926 [Tepidimonas ignava]TSE33058.1 hypothetical protein Tchar_01939 [Tepidimonas charontis]